MPPGIQTQVQTSTAGAFLTDWYPQPGALELDGRTGWDLSALSSHLHGISDAAAEGNGV